MKKWILAALAAAVLTGGALTVSAINGSTLAAPVSANTVNSTAFQSQTVSCPYHENCPNDGNCDGTPDRDGNGAQYRHHGENCGSGCHQGRK